MRRVLSGGVELPGLREGATYNYIGAPNQLLLPLNVVDAGAGVGRQPWKATQHRPRRPTPIPTLKYLLPDASKPALIAPIVPFERMAAHCSSLMRRTSIPIPHAVTSPAPALHPLQPLQTTCHGAAKSAMTSCSRRGSSLHQFGHPQHICIRQALRQGTSARRQMASKASVVWFPDSVRLIQSVTVPAFSGAHA